MRTQLIRLLLALLLLGALTMHAESEPITWLRKPFHFSARNDNITLVLENFCASQGVSAIISPRITGQITGDFAFSNPTGFLDVLARNNGFTWYFHGNSAYFYALSEMETALIALKSLSPQRLQATLQSMGIYDARYPLSNASEEQMLYLYGPPRYIELVRDVIGNLEASSANNMVMRVFKLKHAWADDIAITFLDSKINTPGVASLLRSITGSSNAAATSKVESVKPLGTLQSRRATAQQGTQQQQPGKNDDDWSKAARILADPRLNAVIVWDLKERMPYYEQAIAELDIPVGLVEIRAAIIDVSSSRLEELGVSWNVANSVNAAGQGTGGLGVVGGANVGNGNGAINFASNRGDGLNLTTIYARGIDQFMMRVAAIESEGDANVLSRPAVLTLDNVQAMLQKTDTFYVKLQGQEQVDLFNVTYGTILKVTPHIIEEPEGKQIKLVVNIEDGGQNGNAAGADNIPVVSKSTINTQAIVGESQALIIGGHYFEKNALNNSGIPGLKRTPLLGRLFSTDKTETQKVERLFVISPKIVDLSTIAAQQERIRQETFTRTMIDANTPGSMPKRTTPGGCARTPVSAER